MMMRNILEVLFVENVTNFTPAEAPFRMMSLLHNLGELYTSYPCQEALFWSSWPGGLACSAVRKSSPLTPLAYPQHQNSPYND